MPSKIKFFLYARKSTDEENRQVMSLDAQTRELRDFASREKLFVYEIIEESQTAKRPGRPRFDEMLARIERGEANGLLCWDIDRLYRNPIDEGRVRWFLQKSVIASIRTPSRQFFPEDAGLLMGVEGGRATDYIIRLAKNVARGTKEKLRRGEWPGQKPLGYVYDNRLRNIVPDRKKAKIVQMAFEEYATGLHSLNSIADRLFELGVKSCTGRPWSNCAVHHFLTNRLYTGIMKWKDETFEGKYKPLVSPELFDRVQHALKKRERPRKFRKGHNFPFCGIFRCSCGAMISAQWVKGHGGVYRYCRCTRKNGRCSESYVQEKFVAKQCLEMLQPFGITQEEARALHSAIDAENGKEAASLDTAILALQNRMQPLQKKLDRLTHGYLDELIDEDTYRQAKEELVVEKTALKAEKERLHRSRSSYWIEPAREVINALESMGKSGFAESLPQIVQRVQKIGTNPKISGKQVSFSFSEPYASIPSLLASARIATPSAEASRFGGTTANTIWCAVQGSNL